MIFSKKNASKSPSYKKYVHVNITIHNAGACPGIGKGGGGPKI